MSKVVSFLAKFPKSMDESARRLGRQRFADTDVGVSSKGHARLILENPDFAPPLGPHPDADVVPPLTSPERAVARSPYYDRRRKRPDARYRAVFWRLYLGLALAAILVAWINAVMS